MIRWIAFDDETAEAVVSRYKRGAAEIQNGDPLSRVLDSARITLLVLPSRTPGMVLLARCEPKSASGVVVPTALPSSLPESSENENPLQTVRSFKRKWWQKTA